MDGEHHTTLGLCWGMAWGHDMGHPLARPPVRALAGHAEPELYPLSRTATWYETTLALGVPGRQQEKTNAVKQPAHPRPHLLGLPEKLALREGGGQADFAEQGRIHHAPSLAAFPLVERSLLMRFAHIREESCSR